MPVDMALGFLYVFLPVL